MKYQYLLALFLALMVIPIVKADGCGLTCPKHPDNALSLTLVIICQLFTWSFCHVFSFFVMLILVIVTFVFWRNQSEGKRKKVKLFLYGLGGILFIAMLYPYIRAWTSIPIGYYIETIPVDTCQFFDNTTCVLYDTGEILNHTPTVNTNQIGITCPIGALAEIYTSGIIDLINLPPVNKVGTGHYYITINTPSILENVFAVNLTEGVPYGIELIQCSS
jgi:hypothetical protein